MRNYLLFFLIFILTFSCSENSNQINYKENLTAYLLKNYSNLKVDTKIEHITLTNANWTNEFYANTNHSPIWISDSLELNKNAYDFINLLCSSYNYGLDTSYYFGNSLKILSKKLMAIPNKEDRYAVAADLEILLTNSYFLFAKDINYGIVPSDSTKLASETPRKNFEINLPEYLFISSKKNNITTMLLKLQPQHQEYINLQKQLEKYLKTASISKEKIKVEPFKLDSIKSYGQSKKALILHNYLAEQSTDSSYFAALKLFQLKHGLSPDGLIGTNTANALSKSPYDDYKQAVLSLEKWRWKKDWGADYIFVNIPSYQLKIYQKNNLKKTFKVVVGKPDNPTPEINDEMEYLIIYPFWNVPYSISSKELLPKIKKDSTYLTRNNYQVFTNKNKPINTSKIDWAIISENNLKYSIRQNSGSDNSLGLIKFVFPNKHSIYIHDTPSKGFFMNDIRAYSHGCIRVQQPFLLADLLLSNDNNKYNIDSLHVFVDSKTQKRIKLNKHIPIYIEYFTCGTDTNNNLVFYKDIYGLDKKLEDLMQLKHHSKPTNSPELVNK